MKNNDRRYIIAHIYIPKHSNVFIYDKKIN